MTIHVPSTSRPVRRLPEAAAGRSATGRAEIGEARLRTLRIGRFKSLADVMVDLPHVAVLFGHNPAGKGNLLDGLQALSPMGTLRTLSDALAEPIRGCRVESCSFPPGGCGNYSGSLQQASYRERTSRQIETPPTVTKSRWRSKLGPAA